MRPNINALAVVLLVCSVFWLGTARVGLGLEQRDDVLAQRLFEEGQRLERELDLEAALKQYSLVVDQFPESPLAPKALLRLAQQHWSAGNVESSLQATNLLRTTYAKTTSSAGALVLEGDIQLARAQEFVDLEAAQASFDLVSLLFTPNEHPVLDWRSQALIRSGHVSLLLGKLDDAATAFITAIENETVFSGTSQAEIGLATVFLRRGHWIQAAEILQRVIDTASSTDGISEDESAQIARHWLSLIHRTILRPSLGQAPWTKIRHLSLSGRDVHDPIGVDARGDGWVVITQDEGPLVAIVDPEGIMHESARYDRLRGAWWDTNNQAYALTERTVFESTSRESYTFEVPSGRPGRNDLLERLAAGAHNILGSWFLLDTDPRRVVMFTATGTYHSTLMERVEEPRDLAADGMGHIFVLHEQGTGVVRFNAEGVRESRVITRRGWKEPVALAVDRLGHLYVLDRSEKTIDVFSATGEFLVTIGPKLFNAVELDDPLDIAVDHTGRLYIADRGLDAILVLE